MEVFPTAFLLYFVYVGILHLIAFVIGVLILAVLPRRQPGVFLRRIKSFGSFLALFLIVGAFFNGLWSCFVHEKMYLSSDYDGIGFLPFLPITQGAIDATFDGVPGQLLGFTLFQLQLVWLLFAAATWGATIFLPRLLRRWPDG